MRRRSADPHVSAAARRSPSQDRYPVIVADDLVITDPQNWDRSPASEATGAWAAAENALLLIVGRSESDVAAIASMAAWLQHDPFATVAGYRCSALLEELAKDRRRVRTVAWSVLEADLLIVENLTAVGASAGALARLRRLLNRRLNAGSAAVITVVAADPSAALAVVEHVLGGAIARTMKRNWGPPPDDTFGSAEGV